MDYKDTPILIADQKDPADPKFAYITLGHNKTL